jgi:hypothetical protein
LLFLCVCVFICAYVAAAVAPLLPKKTAHEKKKTPLPQSAGGVAKLKRHPFFGRVDWDELREGRATLPLGLRERLFAAAASAERGDWAPARRPPGTSDPLWLNEF